MTKPTEVLPKARRQCTAAEAGILRERPTPPGRTRWPRCCGVRLSLATRRKQRDAGSSDRLRGNGAGADAAGRA
ncbi:MAG: hypothetical protein HS111_09320 [Kofleriaceae bacterium]|nr:hypothetical protein [Kofleriaceae bacterium]